MLQAFAIALLILSVDGECGDIKIPEGCKARCECTAPDSDGNQDCKWVVECPAPDAVKLSSGQRR